MSCDQVKVYCPSEGSMIAARAGKEGATAKPHRSPMNSIGSSMTSDAISHAHFGITEGLIIEPGNDLPRIWWPCMLYTMCFIRSACQHGATSAMTIAMRVRLGGLFPCVYYTVMQRRLAMSSFPHQLSLALDLLYATECWMLSLRLVCVCFSAHRQFVTALGLVDLGVRKLGQLK